MKVERVKNLLLALVIFMPGWYSHKDGKRVRQYTPSPKVAALPAPKVEGFSRQWLWERGRWSSSLYYRREKL